MHFRIKFILYYWLKIGQLNPSRHHPDMDKEALIGQIQQRLPHLLAVYAFGSRIHHHGEKARADSDLDLAVLLEGYGDPVTLFNLCGSLADIAGCPVNLLHIRAASTVMQYQTVTIKRCVARARDEYNAEPETFATNFTRQDAAILNIQRAHGQHHPVPPGRVSELCAPNTAERQPSGLNG